MTLNPNVRRGSIGAKNLDPFKDRSLSRKEKSASPPQSDMHKSRMNRNSPDVVDSVELKLQRSMSSVKHQFGGSITPKSESKHKIVQKFLDRNTSSMNVVQDAKGRFGSTSHRKKVSSMNVREDTY